MKNLVKMITGAADREKKWMEMPLAVPEQYQALRPGSDDLIISGEFIRASDKSCREYMAAIRDSRNNHWYMWQVMRFMDRYDAKPLVNLVRYDGIDDPLHVTEILYGYEESMRSLADRKGRPVYETIPSSHETYKAFALRYGIQFTTGGVPYRPNLQDVASKPIILHGEALKKFFDTSAGSKNRTAWEHVGELLAVTMPEIEKICKVQPYALRNAQAWCEKINRNADVMLSERDLPQWYADNWYPDEMSKIIVASAVITYLDQAAQRYVQAVKIGVEPALQELKNIDHWIKGPVFTMTSRYFGIKKGQIQYLKDAVIEGRYQGDALPLQKFIAISRDPFKRMDILKRRR